jgi:ComF family protein
MSDPPKIDRIRAAVAYDDISRSIALRLKYGRKVALARTMARHMAPLGAEWGDDALVVPIPLHRWRLWNRGFNQSALVARELAKSWRLPVAADAVSRYKPTRPLKGMNHSQRRMAVAGAFRVSAPGRVSGRTVILIDDVMTSGSTGESCARALRKAGASRVELICWARVVRPTQIMR